MDGGPKSKKGYRKIATHPDLIGLIKNYIKENMDSYRLFDMQPNPYSNRWKKIIKIHNQLLLEKKKCLLNDLPFEQKAKKGQNKHSLALTLNVQEKPLPEEARFYDLRHYHASVLYKCGVPDQYAAARMGHDVSV